MNSVTLRYPGQLSFGTGCLRNFVQDIIERRFQKVFVVTFEEIFPALQEHFDKLKREGISVSTDISIVSEPTYSSFKKVWEAAEEIQPDCVAGIGGGSTLDVAKLVAAQLGNTQSLKEIIGIGNLNGRKTSLACLPTTAGTGSEVSPNAILLDESDQLKKGVVSPFLVPDASYVDPLLTITVPPQVTAATGLDALTHCIEAYANKFAHPVVDVYALEGVRLISANLVRAVKNGDDISAREKMALGSLYGGMCLGPVNTAAVHALSYPLGGEFHVAHGISNAVLLPDIINFNLQAAPDRYKNIARALGIQYTGDTEEIARAGVEKIRELMASTGIPMRLSELNIPRDAIPRMAAAALKVTRLLKNNVREIALRDAIEIYEAAY